MEVVFNVTLLSQLQLLFENLLSTGGIKRLLWIDRSSELP